MTTLKRRVLGSLSQKHIEEIKLKTLHKNILYKSQTYEQQKFNLIKSMAYSSQERHARQLDAANDWRTVVRWDNTISITISYVYII